MSEMHTETYLINEHWMPIKRSLNEWIQGQRGCVFYNITPAAAVHRQYKSKYLFPFQQNPAKLFLFDSNTKNTNCHILKTYLNVSICYRKERLMFTTCVLNFLHSS